MYAYTAEEARHGGCKAHQILDWCDTQPDNPWAGYYVKTRRFDWHPATDREREQLRLPPRLAAVSRKK